MGVDPNWASGAVWSRVFVNCNDDVFPSTILNFSPLTKTKLDEEGVSVREREREIEAGEQVTLRGAGQRFIITTDPI